MLRHHQKNYSSRAERYWDLVDIRDMSECWPWKLKPSNNGYGILHYSDRRNGKYWNRGMSAHRYGFSLVYGEIPRDMFVDHACLNRICQNPLHLRLLTPRENSSIENITEKITCKNGHPYIPENIVLHSTNGARMCIICKNQHAKESARRCRQKQKLLV